MIKLLSREMKSLSRILTVCLCCVPVFGAVAAPVATTAGSNLTAYNPSNAYNNQWATISNGRYDGNTTARVDFGNCNAVVLRCAQPKCGNGGCADASVAAAIVSGCVKTNNQCKQYGDDLIEYMTAQLVASSTAKMNQQQAAIAQAQAAAEAQAAAAQNEQIEQMQNQMYQMQQQMAQQQAESAAALQEALAQQAAQSAAALEDVRSAATDAAKQTEAGITAYQQEAIDRGIGKDVLMRQQVTGQIQTQIEDAETSLVAMKKSLQNSFNYAGCDARGNNCTGPRRIKKWRELSRDFLDPYDKAIDKIYDALDTARMVGVDLTQIYAMLDDTCNSWSQYLCPGLGKNYYVTYGYTKTNSSGEQEYISDAPRVCYNKENTPSISENDWKQCRQCTWLKPLTDGEEIYAGWMDIEHEATDQQRVVACSANALDNNKLFARRTRNKKGKGIIEIDLLDRWLSQVEPSKTADKTRNPAPEKYCGVEDDDIGQLESITLSKAVNADGGTFAKKSFCVTTKGPDFESTKSTEECPYINPLLAICDTHPYNIGESANWSQGAKFDTTAQEKMNRVIGYKVTIVSQQMYKQYEYLNATMRKLKTQLQKAVLLSNLEAAGAKSEDGSSGGGLVGGKSDSDKEIILAGAENCWNSSSPENAYSCIQNNLNVIKSNASTNKQKAAKQLVKTVSVAGQWGVEESCSKEAKNCKCDNYKSGNGLSNTTAITECANALSIAVARKIADEKKDSGRQIMGYGMR